MVNYLEDRKVAEKTLQGIEDAGRRGIVVQADGGDKNQVEVVVNQALEVFGKVDILMKSPGMKRAAAAGEIAKVALFLASEDANDVTGSTYVMDGGLMQYMGQGA